MSLVIFIVDSPPAKLRGRLQRLFLELRPGVFVGNIPASVSASVWKAICDCEVVAVAATAGKTESGFRIASVGKNARNTIDNFGIQLVSYTKQEKRVKHQ